MASSDVVLAKGLGVLLFVKGCINSSMKNPLSAAMVTEVKEWLG